MTSPLVLASSSPFRRQLLENAGLAFSTETARIDERQIEEGLASKTRGPESLASELACRKALEVSARRPDALVIGCDQTMAMGSQIFHKPTDLDAARRQLQALRGGTHRLYSGICVVRNGEVVWKFVGQAELTMRNFSDEFLDRYLTLVGAKALTSVGAYQLEAEGIQLFSSVVGDYFTIIGLPLMALLEQLRRMGEIDA